MIQELEDRGRGVDYSFLTGLDSVLWRVMRFQNAARAISFSSE